jgi:hypothetical protein
MMKSGEEMEKGGGIYIGAEKGGREIFEFEI